MEDFLRGYQAAGSGGADAAGDGLAFTQGELCGEDALTAVVDGLLSGLQRSRRLGRFVRPGGDVAITTGLRSFLSTAFGGGSCPNLRVDGRLVADLLETLEVLLCDVMRQPLPLGEDSIVATLAVVQGESWQRDHRVAALQGRLRAATALAAIAETSPSELGDCDLLSEAGHQNDAELAVADELEPEESVPLMGNEAALQGTLPENSVAAFAAQDLNEVNVMTFEELVLDPATLRDMTLAWEYFLSSNSSREAAGEAIYSALFDAAPSLQSLFKTPRAVMAMRFMNGLHAIVKSLDSPKDLKSMVEMLGFQHLDLDVTVPRVAVFRDAIVDLMETELGDRMTSDARNGWRAALNYVGGAYIYIRTNYTDRIRILTTSWAKANKREVKAALDGDEELHAEEFQNLKLAAQSIVMDQNDPNFLATSSSGKNLGLFQRLRQRFSGKVEDGGTSNKKAAKSAKSKNRTEEGSSSSGGSGNTETNMTTLVPTTFAEMFRFNAVVMGYSQATWMDEVLDSFDTVVLNVANSYRLQEECDFLSLKIAKHRGAINLPEFKAVMMAALRSLLPQDWNSAHEVAWSWLWENVERMLRALLGKPAVQERALGSFLGSLDEATRSVVRSQVYSRFFVACVAGQEYFKQSTTRLHWIADRILEMTLEIYREPKKMIQDLSALGLRHVGYGIPIDLFSPFVTVCIGVLRSLANDPAVEESFRWSLGLISRILVRTITEGSTIVMKAINSNTERQLRKAVACAPRGQRAMWVLRVQVGTQSISPLMWAVQSGRHHAARAVLLDLLTIRADRDHYYYGVDELFDRHPDIVLRLCQDAPGLLPTLLSGLMWRSKLAVNGTRRVNYYIKHLVVDADGKFSKALEWIANLRDPAIVCHPVVALLADTLWGRLVHVDFALSKARGGLTAALFVISQSILSAQVARGDGSGHAGRRIAVAIIRLVIYLASMLPLLVQTGRILVPAARVGKLRETISTMGWQMCIKIILVLVLVLMLAQEPILYCLSSGTDFLGSGLFTETCPQADGVRSSYSVFSMIAAVLFSALLLDMVAFSNQLSAYILMCGHVVPELGLVVLAVAFLILMFSCATKALSHEQDDFQSIPSGALTYMRIVLDMYSEEAFESISTEPALFIAVVLFMIITTIFLLNLLIVQIGCSYSEVEEDMMGYARLNRIAIINEALPKVSPKRWSAFVEGLGLEDRLEFNEGDVGLAGGLQVEEPASLNPTSVDQILRFGGSTDPGVRWPEERQDKREEAIERMERAVTKLLNEGKRSRTGSSASGSQQGSALTSSKSGSSGSGGSQAGSE